MRCWALVSAACFAGDVDPVALTGLAESAFRGAPVRSPRLSPRAAAPLAVLSAGCSCRAQPDAAMLVTDSEAAASTMDHLPLGTVTFHLR